METEGTETVIPEGEPQAPTAEEQMQSLQTLLKTEQDKSTRLEEGYKGLQTTVNKKDAELKQQVGIGAELRDLKELVKLQIAYNETMSQDASITEPDKRQELLRKFDDMETRRNTEIQDAEQKQKTDEWTELASDFSRRMEALGISTNDDTGFEIYNLVTTQDPIRIDRARSILTKLEADKVTTKEPDKGDEERINTLAEEKARKMMQEGNLLNVETTTPSAATTDARKARQDYIEGTIDAKTANQRGANIG